MAIPTVQELNGNMTVEVAIKKHPFDTYQTIASFSSEYDAEDYVDSHFKGWQHDKSSKHCLYRWITKKLVNGCQSVIIKDMIRKEKEASIYAIRRKK